MPASSPSHLTCFCGAINEPASLLADQTLPIENYFCHCDTCRFSTGALAVAYLTLTTSPSEKSLKNTTGYRTSAGYTRLFCKECGCNAFIRGDLDGSWICSAGIVEFKDDPSGDEQGSRNVSKLLFHEYVGDAKDGGLATFLTKVGGRAVPCYTTEPPGETSKAEAIEDAELQRLRNTAVQPSSTTVRQRGDMLELSCHCGGCQLRIAQPPYDESSQGWFVPQTNRKKYYARFCGCRSCRLTLGFSLQPWTYIPPSQIFTRSNEPIVLSSNINEPVQLEKLKWFKSSETVLRSFCSVCGASVLYQPFERPYIVDISVGVLRSKFGHALVGEWLEWDRSVVSKRNEVVDEEIVDAWLST
jgi:hypothetical protein